VIALLESPLKSNTFKAKAFHTSFALVRASANPGILAGAAGISLMLHPNYFIDLMVTQQNYTIIKQTLR